MIYLVLPNWQSFWQAEALSINVDIPWAYLWWSFVYMFFDGFIFFNRGMPYVSKPRT